VEVAVELPFTIVFEPPSRSELRALLRMRGHWAAGVIVALTIGTIYLIANVARADAGAPARPVPLQLTSAPAGAAVWVDGHQRGVTPVVVPVEPGVHAVTLKASETLETHYSLDVGAQGETFAARLWGPSPRVTHLRPTLPGARLGDVRPLANGELGLAVTLPPGLQVEGWSLDPASGAVDRLMRAVPGTRLAFAPDARHLAFLGSEIGPSPVSASWSSAYDAPVAASQPGPRQTMVWIFDALGGGSAAPTAGWRPPLEQGEQLVDVSWSPQASQLLVIANQPPVAGASRTHAWFVEPGGQYAVPAATLPSDIVPGTEAWSPDGTHVAFVAHAGQVNALCLLGIDGSFRYVADLDPSVNPAYTYPPLSWSADGQRLVFVAPHQRVPGAAFDWLQPASPHAIFLAALEQPTPSALTDTTLDQVTWREDGQLLGLGRPGPDAPLGMRALTSSGERPQDLVQLPLKAGPTYTSAWDLSHAQVLVSSRTTGNTNDYWLVRLGVEGDQ
jgi:hypothetical protein